MQRDTTLDLAKGLLIILVVLGHAIQFSFGTEYTASGLFFEDPVYKSIYTFHMPLFMLVSGYLFFNSNKKDFRTLASSKLKAIGIPMLSFILITDLPKFGSLVYHGDILGAFLAFMKTIFCGWTMWFLFSILLNIAIIAMLTRIVRNKRCQYVTMLCLVAGSMFVPDSFLLSVHKFMFPFFCIGYFLKETDTPLYACAMNKTTMAVLTLLSIGAVCWFGFDTYIYTTGFCVLGDFANQLFIDAKRMLIALIVSFTFMQYMHILAVAKKCRICNFVIRLGQMSLFVYGFNIFFDAIYKRVLSHLDVNLGFNYLIPILFATCVIAIAAMLYNLLEKNKVARLLFLGK